MVEFSSLQLDLAFAAFADPTRRAILERLADEPELSVSEIAAPFAVSLPAVIDYVAFMKVQETSYLDIRFDLLFSIYVIFAVAAILRYLWLGWRALLGNDPGPPDPTKAGSGV